ncbi:MAG TPA: hypothetical protein VH391_02045 [Solirubrobacterales bacterium]
MTLATVVDWSALLKTVAGAFVAGVGVTLVFSVAIFAAARFADLSRDGRPVGAAGYVALSAFALAAVAAAVAVGIIVVTTKS